MKKYGAILLIASILLGLGAMPLFADPLSTGSVQGYFKSSQTVAETGADGKPLNIIMLEIEDYSGNTIRLQLSSSAKLYIDQRETTLGGFKKNMEIYAELSSSEVVRMEGYSTVNPGYVAPGSRQREGTITLIERDQMKIALSGGQILSCFTGPATLVSKYGTQSSLSELVVGDKVKLYFDDADATSCVIYDENTLIEYSIVSRIEVMDETAQIIDVFKGELVSVDRTQPLLTFKDVKVLKNGRWSDYQSSLQITYNESNPIYLGGQEISRRNLKNYAGKDVFWVNRDRLGNSTLTGYDTIEKMVIKGQYSTIFTDQITNLNWYNTSFELANKQNISFHNGTIILKDGRVQATSALANNQNVLVLADGNNGAYSAAVVMIMNDGVASNNISQKQIYCGKLIVAAENQVIISDYYWLKDNEWLSLKDDKPFFWDEDSVILVYDKANTKMVQISGDDFLAGNYVVNEHSSYATSNNLKSYYAYIYADGDRVVAMMLQPTMDTLLVQRITTARLSQVENHTTLGWRFILKDSSDWSNRQDQWVARTGALNVTLNKAMIIKNNHVILTDQLKTNLSGALSTDMRENDQLLIIRNDIEAKIVLVK